MRAISDSINLILARLTTANCRTTTKKLPCAIQGIEKEASKRKKRKSECKGEAPIVGSFLRYLDEFRAVDRAFSRCINKIPPLLRAYLSQTDIHRASLLIKFIIIVSLFTRRAGIQYLLFIFS